MEYLNTSKSLFSRFFAGLSRLTLSKRFAVFLAVSSIVSGVATYSVLTKQSDNINTVYSLLNVDLVLLLLLGTVVARHLVRIWTERRKGKAGSRLQARFVFIFSMLTATPAIVMAIFSAVFLYFGVQTWFNERVSTAVKESLEVAQAYLNEHQQVMRADVLAMANDLNREAVLLMNNEKIFQQLINTQAQLRNLSEAIVFTSDGEVIARARLSYSLDVDDIEKEAMATARAGDVALMTGDDSEHDRIRALVKLDRFFDTYLYVGRMVDGSVLLHMQNAEKAVQEYTTLEGRSSKLQVSITIMFIVVSLLLMMAAVWLGLVVSQQLVAPITALIQAADKARLGDLGVRVQEQGGDDEIAILGQAFNRMTSRIEAVLSGASSGVIGLDHAGHISFINLKATEILQAGSQDKLAGQKLTKFLPVIHDPLQKAFAHNDQAIQIQTDYAVDEGPKRTLLIRITAERGREGEGAVVTIDDITALVSAQRKAVWADVARRIAHEIKNPLTPIQLSAERLRRKYLPQIQDDPETFEKCTETIIRQVADIGHMVGEFSSFARMPLPVKRTENIVELCQSTCIFQQQAHPDIQIDFQSGAPEILAQVDPSQINQVLTNLLQNAIDSISEQEDATDTKGHITMMVERRGKNAVLTVTDNGKGLPAKDRDKLTEPYVTTRKKGTGLGLAIVKKILEDHEGSISLTDRMEEDGTQGARAVVVFPLEAKE